MGQCAAKSKRTGERCKKFCAPGKTVCRMHGGASPGAPRKNKNAFRHGAYETLTRETMFEDEIEFADSLDLDPAEALKEQIRILRVKELRLAKRMKKALCAEEEAGKPDGNGGKKPQVVLMNVSKTQSKNYDGLESATLTSNSETHEMRYLRLDAAHTIVLEQIRRAMTNLAQIQAEMGMDDEPLPLYTLPPECCGKAEE